jgi:hypothetical protein
MPRKKITFRKYFKWFQLEFISNINLLCQHLEKYWSNIYIYIYTHTCRLDRDIDGDIYMITNVSIYTFNL